MLPLSSVSILVSRKDIGHHLKPLFTVIQAEVQTAQRTVVLNQELQRAVTHSHVSKHQGWLHM